MKPLEKMQTLPVILLLVVGLFLSQGHGWSIAHEENLRSTLLTSYTTTVRPHETVYVSYSLVVLCLNSLNIGDQFMSMTAIHAISWQDPRLTWNPSTYGNIEDLSVAVESIWTPAFAIENAVSDLGRIGGKQNDDTHVRVSFVGEVDWFPPIQSSTSCEMEISHFPFDKQECTITVTSWAMTEKEIGMYTQDVTLIYYADYGEWDMMKWTTSNGTFSAGSDYYTRLRFTFTFRRRWQFYGQNLLMPIVLTSLLMAFVFMLPIESGEKMGYSLTVLLSYVVFLTWVTDSLPPMSNQVSMLQVYLAIILCLGVLATMLTCWILLLYHRQPTQPMSRPMRFIVTRVLIPLRNFTCSNGCRRPGKRDKVRPGDDPASLSLQLAGNSRTGQLHPVSETLFDKSKSAVSKRTNGVFRSGQHDAPDPRGIVSNERNFSTSQSKETSKVPLSECENGWPNSTVDHKLPEMTKEEECSWQELAVMFDNFFLIIFLTIMPLCSAIILALLYQNHY